MSAEERWKALKEESIIRQAAKLKKAQNLAERRIEEQQQFKTINSVGDHQHSDSQETVEFVQFHP